MPANFLYITWKELKRDDRCVSDVIAQDYAEYGFVSHTNDCKFFFARRGWPLVVARVRRWFWDWRIAIADERQDSGYRTLCIAAPSLIAFIPLACRKPYILKL